MTKSRTYRQKTAAYWAFINGSKGRTLGPTDVYNHFEHTTNGMRKTDFLKAIKHLIEARTLHETNRDSTNMQKGNVKNIKAALYRTARDQTERGRKEKLKTIPKKDQQEFLLQPADTVEKFKARLYAYKHYPTKDEILDWYV